MAGALAFAYNGRDDRVSMTSASLGTRFFVYGPDARVLGEYGQSAADVKAEFIWLSPEAANDNALGGDDGTGGYAPLTLVTPDSTGTPVLSWVYGNHLGVPIVTTDASGNPATPPSYYLAPGFPGQSRTLADLYYNRYRDFDPTTGRYIQADPIGLNGGQNRYSYVDGNPVNFTDPSGRCIEDFCIIEGALIWGGIELGSQAISNWWQGRKVLDPNCYDWLEVGTSAAFGAFGSAWVKGWVRMPPGFTNWNNVSRRIRRAKGLIGEPIDLHHWLVPQKWFKGNKLGEWLFNRPWNLNPVARRFHREVLNPANPLELLLRGAPKPVLGAAVFGAVRAGEEVYDYTAGRK